MLDIIFISYDEPNADHNFSQLKARFPHARRIHGVKGIANAHIAASKKALTKFFYVVDGDADVNADFDFSFKPGPGDEEFVHIWHAYNPAIGIDYGYGGVKLFNKKFFRHVTNQLDFTTTLTKDIKIHTEVACTTRFNSDLFRAYRGAFRESAKLYRTAHDASKNLQIRVEARLRLEDWVMPLPDCAFRGYVIDGVVDGIIEARKQSDLSFINDHDFIISLINKRYFEQ